MLHLNSNQLLSIFQSGFRPFHSTSTALLNICDNIRRNIDSNKFTTLVLLDFSKAFDSVDYDLYLRKLKNIYGFSKEANYLVDSYLRGRCQQVFSSGEFSDVQKTFVGVPQGSVLGPLFFSMFINDVTNAIKNCSVHLYADDLQIYINGTIENVANCIEGVNIDLNNIHDWAFQNRLTLNAKKSQAIIIAKRAISTTLFPIIYLNGVVIPYLDKVRNLGLIMNKTLKWDDQLSLMSKRIHGILRILWQIGRFANTNLRRRLFLAFLFPHFLYCDTVMYDLSHGNQDKIRLLFNSCIRFVYGLRKFDHISEYKTKLLNCELQTYFKYRLCISIFKLIKFKQPVYLFSKLKFARSARTQNIIVDKSTSNHFNSSYFIRGMMIWNGLNLEIKNAANLSEFKTLVFNHLKSYEELREG